MTTDSMPIPDWSEVQAALEAHRRRQDEQRKELSTINRLRGAGAVMLAVGFLGGALLLAAWISNREADQLRHAINPYATMLTLGGLILLLFGINRAAHHREYEELVAKLAKLERRQATHHDDRRPQRRRRRPRAGAAGRADGHPHEPVDPKYLADMSEAVRLGEELAKRKLNHPDQTSN